MKTFSWNHDKNKRLQQERGISFEEAAFHIKNGGVLAVIAHPNQAKYQNQWLYVVVINNYA